MNKQIKSMEELKREATRGKQFRMILNYGVYSRKTIEWDKKKKVFRIKNWIDDSKDKFTEKGLMDENITLIGKAIKRGALVMCDEDNN